MKLKAFILLIILSNPSLAEAIKEKFIDGDNYSNNDIKLLKASFINKGWGIQSYKDSSVTGYLKHRGIDAKLELKLEDGKIFYYCTCTREAKKGGPGGKNKIIITKHIPQRWINNLIKEFKKLQLTSSSSDIKSRLNELKNLHDEGFITDDDYHSRKTQILSEI